MRGRQEEREVINNPQSLCTLRVCAPFPTRNLLHSASLPRLWWQKSPLGLASWALGSSLVSRGTVFLKARASSGSGPCWIWRGFCSESKFSFRGGKRFEIASLGEMGDIFSRICWTQALKPIPFTGRPGNYSGQLRWAPIKSHLHPLWTIKHLRSVCWMILML